MIFRAVLIIVFLTAFINLSSAQNPITVSGKVAEDSTLLAIPRAIASVKGTSNGATTNTDGYFKFQLPSSSNDSLLFSCLGYYSQTLSIRDFLSRPDSAVILKRRVYELDSVSVYGLRSKQIVENAIRKIPELFAADTFYQKAFYRQYHNENNLYVRLIEAAVTIENRVEKNKTSLKGKERISIIKLRRSDNSEQNKEVHGDHLTELLEENPIYHSAGTMLNLKALNLYRFYFDTTLTHPDSVFHIFYYSTDRSHDRFDRGEIFIDANSYAILKFTKEEFRNSHAVRRQLYNSSAPYRWEFQSLKLVAEYTMMKEKMIPALLCKTYSHELYDNKVHTKEYTVAEFFELTLEKEISLQKPMQETPLSVFSDLYHRRYAYDISFWQNYSVPDFYLSKSQDVKFNLEKKKNLNEQFLQNGNK